MFPSFPNYTEQMYEGNEPCGKGHELIEGGFADRWECKWGSAETNGNRIIHASFSINQKINIFIIESTLWITDFRYEGKSDVWEYSNNDNIRFPGSPCLYKRRRHELEKDKIEKILNTNIPCKLWELVQQRSKELYQAS